MNQVWLNGRLAADPEKGTSAQGVDYATFTVAMDKRVGDAKETIFLDCCAFRKTSTFVAQYFKKGDAINVVGSVNVRNWEDRNGLKHRKYEILVNQVGFPISGRSRGTGKSNGEPQDRAVPAGSVSDPRDPGY